MEGINVFGIHIGTHELAGMFVYFAFTVFPTLFTLVFAYFYILAIRCMKKYLKEPVNVRVCTSTDLVHHGAHVHPEHNWPEHEDGR